MRSLPHLAIRCVGIIGILTAICGIIYTAILLWASHHNVSNNSEAPYFALFLYAMSLICMIFYLSLFVFGVQFLHLRTQSYIFFIATVSLEVVYFCFVSVLWIFPIPSIAFSVAAATGANAGLLFQFFILFPLWAPFVVVWAHRKMERDIH